MRLSGGTARMAAIALALVLATPAFAESPETVGGILPEAGTTDDGQATAVSVPDAAAPAATPSTAEPAPGSADRAVDSTGSVSPDDRTGVSSPVPLTDDATASAPPAEPGREPESVAPLSPEPRDVAAPVPSEPAAKPADAAAPAATTASPLDVAVGERLAAAEFLPASRLGKEQREAIRQYYQAAGGHALWIDGNGWSTAGRSLIERLEKAYEDGLEASDYTLPAIAILPTDKDAALADADIKLSAAAVLYARDASGGRLDLRRVSALITPTITLPEPAQVLDAVHAASDPGVVLANYNPHHPGYLALKRKLADMQAARPAQGPQVRVPPGPTLRVGMRDPRVPLVRVRFALSPSDDELYDEHVAAAVAKFQQENGLRANGVLNRQTLVALAGGEIPSAANASDIIINMERWRWLPRDLGNDYIFVSIPEYTVRLVRGGSVIHESRVIVGKPETPTPIFSNTMQYAIVNPSWYVPPSIMKKEFLPGLAKDPYYAAKRGYEVVHRGGRISIRQPPGERNALGHIKFMFPNDHAVYLHDTPSRALFGSDRRAFSHGCVRVDKPMAFAELVLGGRWTEARIKSLVGRGERTIRLEQPLPIHLTYFTAAVDDGGKLLLRDDLYGYDRRMKVALGLTRR